MSQNRSVQLEPAALQVCRAAAKSPHIWELPPDAARRALDKMQDTPIHKHPAKVKTHEVDAGKWGRIRVYTVMPQGLSGAPSVLLYLHGGGWVLGSLHTHDKLVRELAIRTNSVVVFPEYDRAPEARFPTALEQCYSVLTILSKLTARLEIRPNLAQLTIAGDSAGGNMATALAILAKQRGGPRIHKQLLFYPVTNAAFDTASYRQFYRGYYLYRAGMIWFWNQYTKNARARAQITASPLRASIDTLKELPPALIINGEADVLRDEGEAYARKLRAAGVQVIQARFQATIHDFVMLNALDNTAACRGAMDLAVGWLNQKDGK